MVKLKQLRKQHGWTQQEFANQIGMSLDYVKKVETGRITPSLKALMKMANVLECSTIDELLRAG